MTGPDGPNGASEAKGPLAGADAARLFPEVERELRALAARLMRQERRDHTLQPTALVNEAWLKLEGAGPPIASRAQFFAVAATAMRQVLVDHARARGADKRGGDWERVTLSPDSGPSTDPAAVVDVLALDGALRELAERSPRQARVVELRWFGGLTVPEVAGILGTSTRTIDDDWAAARAWLFTRLNA